jgi:hypothetical protein
MRPIYFCVMIGFFLTASCKPERFTNPKPSILTGYVTAKKNGEPWQAHMFAQGSYLVDTTWQLSIYHYQDTFLWRLTESMEFVYLPRYIREVAPIYPAFDSTGGQQPPSIRSEAAFFFNDDDIIFSGLFPMTNDTFNHFEITKFDTLGGLIEGNFQMRFVAYKKPGPSFPDTLVVIEDGHFSGSYLR